MSLIATPECRSEISGVASLWLRRLTLSFGLFCISPVLASAQPTSSMPSWKVSEHTEALTGASTIYASLDADAPVSNMLGQPELPTFVLACKEGRLSSYIVWPQVLSNDVDWQTMVLWRIDNEPIRTDFWHMSDDETAAGMFKSKDATKFLKQLMSAKRLAVRFRGSSTQDAAFSLQNFAYVAGQVSSRCGIALDANSSPREAPSTAPLHTLAAKPSGASISSTGSNPAPNTMEEAASGAALAAEHGGIGISFVPSPLGAIVMAVAPRSRAALAGLKPGETIEAVNGVTIKGLDAPAITAILHASVPTLTLKVVGVGDVVIKQ